jgi:hypothetical protein
MVAVGLSRRIFSALLEPLLLDFAASSRRSSASLMPRVWHRN